MTTVKEHPILFSAPMIRAILDGTKTQTRRVVKRPKRTPLDYILNPSLMVDAWCVWWQNPSFERVGQTQDCPYGQPGDRLWARETWRVSDQPDERIEYRADVDPQYDGLKWTPSIHMPRWASRITLEITAVRVERLQDISEQDAMAEGINGEQLHSAQGYAPKAFMKLWESINGPGSWAANPWVWCISFRRLGDEKEFPFKNEYGH